LRAQFPAPLEGALAQGGERFSGARVVTGPEGLFLSKTDHRPVVG
jgi:hypothetical protein